MEPQENTMYEINGEKIVCVGVTLNAENYKSLKMGDKWYSFITHSEKNSSKKILRHIPLEGMKIEGKNITLKEGCFTGKSDSFTEKDSDKLNEIYNKAK